MTADIVHADNPALARHARKTTPAAALAALGIVYGDLGTSPLYTLQAVLTATGEHFSPEAALGSLSLIFWALIITISIKYCLFVMRADNHGEGGILALMSMTGANWSEGRRILIVMGLFGAALIYGDGISTRATPLWSPLEGLIVATDGFKPHVVSIAVAILFALFVIQSRGTAQIAKAFGPVMLLWFVVIAALGVAGISRYPAVIAAVDPRYGIALLTGHGWSGIAVLGGVFLAMTGGEAMYADMGHIGRNPIRTSWYRLVLPALLLNYAGQVALYLGDPAMDGNPFFRLAPSWSIYPNRCASVSTPWCRIPTSRRSRCRSSICPGATAAASVRRISRSRTIGRSAPSAAPRRRSWPAAKSWNSPIWRSKKHDPRAPRTQSPERKRPPRRRSAPGLPAAWDLVREPDQLARLRQDHAPGAHPGILRARTAATFKRTTTHSASRKSIGLEIGRA